MYENIEIIRDGRVATVALNRPEVLNAISQAVALEVTAAIRELDSDPGIGVIVITTVYSGGEYFIQNWKCLWD